jgi:hypothetical protein
VDGGARRRSGCDDEPGDPIAGDGEVVSEHNGAAREVAGQPGGDGVTAIALGVDPEDFVCVPVA